MTNVSRAMLSLVVTLLMIAVVVQAPAGPPAAVAATKAVAQDGAKKDTKGAKAAPVASGGHKVNACGCHQDSTGVCFCSKKAKGKCVCPGECEPKGCDEKRAKDIEREIKNETKRAQDSDKKQKAASRKSEIDEDQKDRNAAANKDKDTRKE